MFICWNKNKKFPKHLYNKVVKEIEKTYTDKDKFYTSYWGSEIPHSQERFGRMVDIIQPFYDDIISEMMSEMGLFHRCIYRYSLWIQMYNSKTNTHEPHHHFTEGTDLISWVHFIKSPRQKCFYFLDSKGKKIYPKQNSGDIIAWPSWAFHGVDCVKGKNFNRIIGAGNIHLTTFNSAQDLYLKTS